MSQPTSGPTTGDAPTATTPVRTSAKQSVRSGPVSGTLEADPATAPASSSTTSDRSTGDRSTATSSTGSRPAPKPAPRPAPGGPRRVRLSVSRVDPWSVMKLGFLLSVALGIVTVVAAAVAWKVVDSMGVFADLESLFTDLDATKQFGVVLEYLRLKNVMSLATVVAIINVALITALTTLGAFIYNIVAALVGGLHMTLTDD
ncbi:DUF3566 domain-containing protein [Miniimonas sp. S16]|uniref:DUF3566 domain-containing protein n=1 Tax=Miniimonas sp. S16 TaxID=2171623 RepID=UPI000D525C94|nr:DUF3566 domain-containing protein [Miniimonas sp. S16]